MDRKVKRSKDKAIDYADRIEKKNTKVEMGMKKLKKVVPRVRVRVRVPKVCKVIKHIIPDSVDLAEDLLEWRIVWIERLSEVKTRRLTMRIVLRKKIPKWKWV
ncbi:hypothetical protein ACP275_11G121100 [Erythranthe tilingii]